MARDLKFHIYEVEGLYDLCSENKGADQLRGNREADLRLCLRKCKNPVFSRRGSNKAIEDLGFSGEHTLFVPRHEEPCFFAYVCENKGTDQLHAFDQCLCLCHIDYVLNP